MNLFVVGAGYVGLTTGVGFAQLGHRVTVHDIDPERVASLAAGRAPIMEAGLEEALRSGIASGNLRFTTDPRVTPDIEVALVGVPTPVDAAGLLDTSTVESVVASLVAQMPPDRTIVVRSTLPLHGPARLAAVAGPQPRPAVVVNPEFLREGRALADFAAPSRVVVGHLTPADRPAAEAFSRLYESLGAPTIVADATSVVLIKLASNVFLGTKIAFADELARLSDAIGADISVVVDGIGLDPRIGRAFLDAGPGFGGSCLPEQADAIAVEVAMRSLDAPLLSSVGRANAAHQDQIVAAIGDLLGGLSGTRIALLGLAFKANTDDVRMSPSLAIARRLRAQSADVVAYDPVSNGPARRSDPDLVTVDSAAAAIAGADAVAILTEWDDFTRLDWPTLGPTMRGDLVYDARRLLSARTITDAGLRYAALGLGVRSPGALETAPSADAGRRIARVAAGHETSSRRVSSEVARPAR